MFGAAQAAIPCSPEKRYVLLRSGTIAQVKARIGGRRPHRIRLVRRYDEPVTQEVEAARNEDKKQGPWAVSLAQLWAFAAVALPMIPAMALLGTIDLAYHVRAGELMLHTHSLIRTDGFSFTAAGRPWLDQQWLAQILLSVIFRVLGWRALGLFQMLL